MRPTRLATSTAARPNLFWLAVRALTISLGLVFSSSALRAQAPGGSEYAPAITSTGTFTGVPSEAADNATRTSSHTSPQSGPTELESAAQSAWTADRSLPDKAGQLRPQFSQVEQPAASHHAADFSLPQAESQVGQRGSVAVTSPVVTASATAGASAGASAGVQHIPLAPPSKRLTEDQPQTSGSTLQMLVSIISSLLLVVGLFLGVAWCYRKTLGTSLSGGLPKQVVSILGRTSISARQQLVLVRFGSKLLLVSVIQGEARTLGEISDPLEVDLMLGQCESGQPGSISQSFKSLLHAEDA